MKVKERLYARRQLTSIAFAGSRPLTVAWDRTVEFADSKSLAHADLVRAPCSPPA
jgi:hypothetical protein